MCAVALATTGAVVAIRSDGFTAIDATTPRATRWFVNQADGWVMLADGFSGTALARLQVDNDGQQIELAQSSVGAAMYDTTGIARPIDTAALRFGPEQALGVEGGTNTVVAVTQPGLVAANPTAAEAVLVPPDGEPVRFPLGATGSAASTMVATDGAVWMLAGGSFLRVTTTSPDVVADDLGDDARLTLVGNTGFVFDAGANRARIAGGGWVELPAGLEPTEVVLQAAGPTADCGWLASGDELWCVGPDGIEHTVEVPGLNAGGSDMLAIAGDAALLVDRSAGEIRRFDWRDGELLTDRTIDGLTPGAATTVSTNVDLVWVDETAGDRVWAVHPWGFHMISKRDDSTPLLGEQGETLEPGTSTGSGGGVPAGDEQPRTGPREPDNDGEDDTPVAVDDPVTARTGMSVTIPVTANDYDPDGEAVALFDVGSARRGTVELAGASIAVYQPDPGFVGTDEFEYTITDAYGHTATATVQLTLLPVDAPNNAPIGQRDEATTGLGVTVVVDVLLNDIDPERDSLQIGSFTQPDIGGRLVEAVAPSGLPALRYDPPERFSGVATFTYRPMDAFGAEGDPVVATVEIADAGAANRPPVVQPDAVRVPRDERIDVPVLVNDHDPDGDPMTIAIVEPLPDGLAVVLRGDKLAVTARAGSSVRSKFAYTVADGHNPPVEGSVLVVVAGADEPNRAPIATADTATAVVGTTTTIDVLRNDSDPDGDALVVVDARADSTSGSPGSVRVTDDRVLYTPAPLTSDERRADDRFTYTISDGHGHTATGTVAVRVLAEPIEAPPFARDDSASTTVDVPVTIDVLRNDIDPSGDQPDLLGTPNCPAGGNARRTADRRVEFTPPVREDGVFRCTYRVANSQGLTDSAVITISVTLPPIANVPPIVVDENVTVKVGQQIEIAVLDNDSDPDGPHADLRVVSMETPVAGTATRTDRGTIVYTAPPNAMPSVGIGYQVSDALGGVSGGQVVIRVASPEQVEPVAVADREVVFAPIDAHIIDVTANDSDPDGPHEDLHVVGAQIVSGGGRATYGTTTVRFEPNPDFIGELIASYTIEDADGESATATATLVIQPPLNLAPTAAPVTAEVVNGGTITVPLGLYVTDLDGDALAFSIVSVPDAALGTATLIDDDLTFVSRAGAPSGVAVIGYSVSDGEYTAESTVRIAVQACAVAPPQAPDLFFETGYQEPIAIDLTQYASNGTVTEVGPPLNAPSGVYTPPAGQNGTVTFTYVVINSCNVSAVGTVTIDVNQPPVGSPLAVSIGRFETVTFPVTALASDDELLTITGVPGQPEWVAVVDGGQTLRIEPDGRTGTAAFTVVVSDPGGLTVQVPVTVQLVNQAPVGQPDSVRLANGPVDLPVLANDSDPDGDPVSLHGFPTEVTFSNGGVGSIALNGTALRVSPGTGGGTGSFEYTIVDPYGAVSDPIPVAVTVNSAPTAANVSVEVPWLGTVTVSMPVSDPDGDALEVRVNEGDVPAGFTITTTGTEVTVTNVLAPANRAYDVPYTVTDPEGRTATAVLTITVGSPPTTTTTLPPTTTTTTVPPTTTTTVPPTTPPPTSDPGGGPPGSGPPGSRPPGQGG
jgi:hypothetical protein